MAVDELLREGRIKEMRLPHRLLTGPMERGMAAPDGSLTARYIDYLVERARGGAALIQVESTYVDTRGMGHLYQVGCHGDHVIPALERMAKALHNEGAKVALELYFGGRQTSSSISRRQPLAPSAVECRVLNPTPVPRAMTLADIAEIVERFAQAARRVVEAGLDMIHLHGAHGYLLGSFLSPYSNRRTDRYGGSLENRARFPLQVLAGVRCVAGPAFPIGYRMSAEEYIDGGLTIDESVRFAEMLAKAGIDLIDVSGGIYESGDRIIQGPEAPKGGFVENAALIKQAVGDRVPVSVAQRLNDPDFANEVLLRHKLDFISLTRAFHADPYFVRKIREGRKEEILPCIACHQCTSLLEANLPAGCAANPQTAFERVYRTQRSTHPRFAAVVGGGPAGMHAARILALEGHCVHLCEAGDHLGGQMSYSAQVAPDYQSLIDYLRRQLAILGVKCLLNTKVDVPFLAALKPDVVVVATGAGPGLPSFPIRGHAPVLNLFSGFDRDPDDWGGRTIVAGGDAASCFAALHFARRGDEVHIVEPGSSFGSDKLSPARDRLLSQLRTMNSLHFRPISTVEEAGPGYVLLQREGFVERLENVRRVIVGGRTANSDLYESIRCNMPELEVYSIGDAVRPRDLYAASHEAADVAVTIRLRAAAGAPAGDRATNDARLPVTAAVSLAP
jgi:2,4-dienoyl-CoA reductase-like NADH-dependent reductase (Old Yellow Enzyme family)/thioredoxin reductase